MRAADPGGLIFKRRSEHSLPIVRMNRINPGAAAAVQLLKGTSPDLFMNRTDVQYLIRLGIAHPDRLIDMADNLQKDLLGIPH